MESELHCEKVDNELLNGTPAYLTILHAAHRLKTSFGFKRVQKIILHVPGLFWCSSAWWGISNIEAQVSIPERKHQLARF